jgi:endonuclease-8
MPEGDSIFRAARTLDQALAGRTVTRFQSVFPRLTRIDHQHPVRGQTLDRVTARGKHLLMWFSGGLVLHTHMRMKGTWHLYRPGERWMRPRGDMRIVIDTHGWQAVAFNVPTAEFVGVRAAERTLLADLGPDVLSDRFDPDEAVRRLEARAELEIGDALLDQQALAGIGNIYKSEALYACRVSPFIRIRDLPRPQLERIVGAARRLLRAHASETARPGPRAVYRRSGEPCRLCGAIIQRRAQGAHARSTYWCPRCQRGDRSTG